MTYCRQLINLSFILEWVQKRLVHGEFVGDCSALLINLWHRSGWCGFGELKCPCAHFSTATYCYYEVCWCGLQSPGNPFRWPSSNLITTFNLKDTILFVARCPQGHCPEKFHPVGNDPRTFCNQNEASWLKWPTKHTNNTNTVMNSYELVASLWLGLVAWASLHQPHFFPIKIVGEAHRQMSKTFLLIYLYDPPSVSLEPILVLFSQLSLLCFCSRCHKWTLLAHLLVFWVSFLQVVQAKKRTCFEFDMQEAAGARDALGTARQRVQLWRHPFPVQLTSTVMVRVIRNTSPTFSLAGSCRDVEVTSCAKYEQIHAIMCPPSPAGLHGNYSLSYHTIYIVYIAPNP